jgi:hypothetical protein
MSAITKGLPHNLITDVDGLRIGNDGDARAIGRGV